MTTNADRSFFVTGASSGIGLAVARHLVSLGHTVVAVARDFSKASFEHERFTPMTLDLADIKRLPGALQEILVAHPDISGAVLCAGRGQFGHLEEFSFEQIQRLIELNLTSQLFVARALLPHFKRLETSDLVFLGSEAGLSGGRKGAVYCATKFALRGFTQALREECARRGVRITLINPGMVKTAFFDDLTFKHGGAPENYVLPEDVADAVSLVVSARPGTVFDEINLSPLKKVLDFG